MTFWTDAIADGWTVFNSVAGDMLPVLGLAVGLAVVAFIARIFMGGGN